MVRVPGRRAVTLLAVAVLATAAPLPAPPPARAVARTFVVTSTADPGDGVCDQVCTLREAIAAANANPGRDTIAFAIPGAGVKTIRPTSVLPPVTDPVVVDGFPQPGAKANTLANGTDAVLRIELDGSATTDGLVVRGGGTTIRGLVVNRFRRGIELTNIPGNTDNGIEGNFLGTNPGGTVAAGNTNEGVAMFGQSTGNTIGGPAPAARNLIAGNGGSGIRSNSYGDNVIRGNLIGTDRTGTKPLANGGAGILLEGLGSGDLIRTNVVAFNGLGGVTIRGAAGNRISGNSIFANGGLGIDLGNDGATPNNPGDEDTGANNLQNVPVLGGARAADGKVTVNGRLTSRSNRTYAVQFFANPEAAGAEGKTFLGQQRVTTDGDGHAAFTFSTRRRLLPGRAITATATDEQTGDTSEFSAAKVVKRTW